MNKAFTLVEVLIVVAVLGILAAFVVPIFRDYTVAAKETASKDNLQVLRKVIELYAAQHKGVPPGYEDGDTTQDPTSEAFVSQIAGATNEAGEVGSIGSPDYPLGPYLRAIPENPFNKLNIVKVLENDRALPVIASGTRGWIYQPWAKTIRLDWPGTDSKGVLYFEY